jgi:hypothetical protein
MPWHSLQGYNDPRIIFVDEVLDLAILSTPCGLYPPNAILGETGSVKLSGEAVSEIQNCDFAGQIDGDVEVKSVNCETAGVFGFGYSVYY